MSTNAPAVICLMGPTAAGKTEIALALHAALPVDIISVDSSQVYRGMDIGTAKPTAAERERAPHRLIDIRDPAESYSAAAFRTDALHEIESIIAAGRIPLLVGGTMFYFHALEHGLSDLPSADPEIRRRLTATASEVGWPALHARLRELDPVTAARIDEHDAQRIQRALEIAQLTGNRRAAATNAHRSRYRFVKFALWPDDRAVLHARIARRFMSMLERGLVEEVEGLYRRPDLGPSLSSMRTVGYRQVWNYLTGSINYNEMADRAIAATRQLAKRQLTWLRRYRDMEQFDCTGAGEMSAIVAHVARALR